MKIAFALLVVTCCGGLGEATLKHFKAKLKLPNVSPPAVRSKLVTSPVVLPETVPVVYSSPVSIFGPLASTYTDGPHYALPYSEYKSPVYSAPVVYTSPVALTVPIYKRPLAIVEESPVIYYGEPATVSFEASAFREHLAEGRYPPYGEFWDK